MKTWKEFYEAQAVQPANRPGGTVMDRSLEGFRPVLEQLRMQISAIQNPQAKTEISQLINSFYNQMKGALQKYKAQGIGYSPNYQPDQLGQPPS